MYRLDIGTFHMDISKRIGKHGRGTDIGISMVEKNGMEKNGRIIRVKAKGKEGIRFG
jgi:hypothetical protein